MMQDHQARVLLPSALPAHLLKRPAGAADPDETLRLALRLVPRGGDEALFARVARLGAQHPAQRQYLDVQALAAEFGPDPRALDAVRTFCADRGFALDHTSLGGLFATVVGKAGELARAFGVELGRYRFEDRVFRGYAGALALPGSLVPHVAAVLGLDELSTVMARRPTEQKTAPCWVSADSNAHNSPVTVANEYYRYPTPYSGAGATIALIESDLGIDWEGIDAYFQSLGANVDVELVHGMATLEPPDGERKLGPTVNVEAMLDIKLAGAVAPGATFAVYGLSEKYGHGDAAWIDTLITALDKPARPCHAMSISLGMPESFWSQQDADSVHLLFAIAALQGVTVCVSSGDFGARGRPGGRYKQNCAFPASSPLCLACGGTELLVAADRSLQGEIVWNEMGQAGQKCATGGGRSTLFDVPDYQQGLSLPASFNPDVLAGRAVPDVAANAALASGYALDPNGLSDYYGTSAAAPMWAALVARLIEYRGKPLGYLNPWLYAGQVDGQAAYCTPITQGNNGAPGDTVVFYAEPGNVWNACCGLGSPLGQNIANSLEKAQ